VRQTHRDAAILLRESVELRLPVTVIAQRPVHEQQQFAVAGLDVGHAQTVLQFDERRRRRNGRRGNRLIHGGFTSSAAASDAGCASKNRIGVERNKRPSAPSGVPRALCSATRRVLSHSRSWRDRARLAGCNLTKSRHRHLLIETLLRRANRLRRPRLRLAPHR
jgi:acyl-coenzyme A thioesterase PaaI-like protein